MHHTPISLRKAFMVERLRRRAKGVLFFSWFCRLPCNDGFRGSRSAASGTAKNRFEQICFNKLYLVQQKDLGQQPLFEARGPSGLPLMYAGTPRGPQFQPTVQPPMGRPLYPSATTPYPSATHLYPSTTTPYPMALTGQQTRFMAPLAYAPALLQAQQGIPQSSSPASMPPHFRPSQPNVPMLAPPPQGQNL